MADDLLWHSQGEPHLPADLHWLTGREARYVSTQRYTKRRQEFLVARWTAKQALARALGLAGTSADLSRIEVGHAPDGAPVPSLDGSPLARRMSMTDRAGWAVCLLSPSSAEVGCDLELVEPRSDAFVSDWFTPAERELVGGSTDQQERFLLANLLWSAKESALKVLRTGLRRDTRSVEVALGPIDGARGWSPLEVRLQEGGVFPGWWCRHGDFVLTTATALPLPAPVPMDRPPALASAAPLDSWLAGPLTDAPSSPPVR